MANEKRLIDANVLMDSHWWESLTDDFDKARARIIVMAAPTVDAVEVVRCKDCKYWGGVTFGYVCSRWSAPISGFKTCTKAEGFCADGERKDNA